MTPLVPAITGALLAVVAALALVRVPAPPPDAPPQIRVRWAAGVDDDLRTAREASLRLRRVGVHSERTWTYDLLDASPANIEAIVTDLHVEDTDGVDRREFRVPASSITLAERLTLAIPALERIAGPGFSRWFAREHIAPALFGGVWLVLLWRPSGRAVLLRGIPALSRGGLGLFRIVLGAALLAGLPIATRVPAAPLPRDLHRSADWFAEWAWVHWLALRPEANALVLIVALVALAAFTAGVRPRLSFAVALAAITARIFVVLQHRSAHDLGLPLLALWGLAFVPWHAAAIAIRTAGRDGPAAEARGFALWWPGLVMGLGFLAAAYAKLDTSGWAWISGGAVRYHFIEDFRQAPTDWGLWVAARPALAVVASFAAVVIEAAFVVHVFFRQAAIRTLAGAAALALLTGLYVFQGVFWPAWWILLLVFVPWNAAANRLIARADLEVPGGRTSPGLRRPQLALVALVVCVQLFASAQRVEVEPFVSDYGMYSWTWPSAEAFEQHLARKYRVYRYGLEDVDRVVDVTARVRALPGAADALTEAVDRFRDAGTLSEADRIALRAVHAAYQGTYDESPGPLRVLLEEQAFDWDRARFYPKAFDRPVAIIELSSGTIRPLSAAR